MLGGKLINKRRNSLEVYGDWFFRKPKQYFIMACISMSSGQNDNTEYDGYMLLRIAIQLDRKSNGPNTILKPDGLNHLL